MNIFPVLEILQYNASKYKTINAKMIEIMLYILQIIVGRLQLDGVLHD